MSLSVSIALCTYNGEKYLQQQLDSYTSQTILPQELVACDDKSSDSTIEILQRFSESAPFDVRIQRNAANVGVNRNFSNAILQCQNDIIILCDQDDLWDPMRIEKTVQLFEEDATRMAVAVNGLYIDNKNKVLPIGSLLDFHGKLSPYFNKWMHGYLTEHNICPEVGCSLALRRTFAQQIFPQPEGIAFDIWISCIVPFLGARYGVCPQPLFSHRFHESNYTWSLQNKMFDTQKNIARLKKTNRKFFRRIGKLYRRNKPFYEYALNFSRNYPTENMDQNIRRQRERELIDFLDYCQFRQENQRHLAKALVRAFSLDSRKIYQRQPQPVLSFFYDLLQGFIHIPVAPFYKEKET